jgi:hypothetical protein
MSLRKSLGIIAFCTQAVVAVDYNMQSQKAGLGPGELSMTSYAAIVQARYDKPKAADFAAKTTVAAQSGVAPPVPICVRRGTALNCQ